MKKKACLLVFFLSLTLAAALRLFFVCVLTEYETGFILPSRKTAAVITCAVIALSVLCSAIFAFASTAGGKKSKAFYLLSSLSALALGVSAGFQLAENFSGVPAVLRLLCVAFALLSTGYFVAFAIRAAVHFPFSAKLSAVPAAFFVLKAACVTIKSAYCTVISDTVFEIAAYCFIMLFFLEFARLANGGKAKRSVKKFAAFGSTAALLSLIYSVPKLVLYVLLPSAVHGSLIDDIMLFFAGVYIACEVFSRLSFVQEKDERAVIYYTGKH